MATDSPSKNAVIGFSGWGSKVVNAARAFKDCVNMTGNSIPSWPSDVEEVAGCYEGCSSFEPTSCPAWPTGVSNLSFVYGGVQFTSAAVIPAWTEDATEADGTFNDSGDIGVPPGAGDATLMPSTIVSHSSTVSGSPELEPHFFASWGGTKDTGSRDANIFTIRIGDTDVDNNGDFTFSVFVKSFGAGANPIVIDWGDLNETNVPAGDAVTETEITHTYNIADFGSDDSKTFIVCVDTGASSMRVGVLSDSDTLTASALSVVSCLKWSSTIVDASNCFHGCEHLGGGCPAWGTSMVNISGVYRKIPGAVADAVYLTGSIPQYPETISRMAMAFANQSSLSGTIPEYPNGVSTVGNYQGVYKGCTGLTGVIPAFKWPQSGIGTLTDARCDEAYRGCAGLSGFFNGATTDDVSPLDVPLTGGRRSACYTGCCETILLKARITYGGKFYMIVFSANGAGGGVRMSNMTMHLGIAGTLPPCTYSALSGSPFLGWALTPTGTVAYGDCASVFDLTTTDDFVTLYAKWGPFKYAIVMNPNGGVGNPVRIADCVQGQPYQLPLNTFTLAGHTFIGWARNPSATTAEFADGATITNEDNLDFGNFELYAVWVANTITVGFNGNGGQ